LDSNSGNVDVFAASEASATPDDAVDVVAFDLLNFEIYNAVGNVNVLSLSNFRGQLLVSDSNPIGISDDFLGGDDDLVAALKLKLLIVCELPRADLWALGIEEARDGNLFFVRDPSKTRETLSMFLVVPVRKVEASHIHAGAQERSHSLVVVNGGAKGTYDLGSSDWCHKLLSHSVYGKSLGSIRS